MLLCSGCFRLNKNAIATKFAINKRKNVKPGDIVVARINDEVTVKTLFHFDKRKVILRPENKNYKDIEINPLIESFDIEGKCLGVLRNYS